MSPANLGRHPCQEDGRGPVPAPRRDCQDCHQGRVVHHLRSNAHLKRVSKYCGFPQHRLLKIQYISSWVLTAAHCMHVSMEKHFFEKLLTERQMHFEEFQGEMRRKDPDFFTLHRAVVICGMYDMRDKETTKHWQVIRGTRKADSSLRRKLLTRCVFAKSFNNKVGSPPQLHKRLS